MVYFDWSGGQWTYKNNSMPYAVSVSKGKCMNLYIEINKHTEASKAVGV